MTRRAAFMRGVIAGVLFAFAAMAVNWLISGRNANASDTRVAFVWIQLVGGIIGAVLCARGIPSDVGTRLDSKMTER